MRLLPLAKLADPNAKRAHEIKKGMVLWGRTIRAVYLLHNHHEVCIEAEDGHVGVFHWDHVFGGIEVTQ